MTTSESLPNDQDESDHTNVSWWPWKRTAMFVVGGIGVVVLMGATAVVTLAVTHDSAVRENMIAYLRGWIDGRDDLMNTVADHEFRDHLEYF